MPKAVALHGAPLRAVVKASMPILLKATKTGSRHPELMGEFAAMLLISAKQSGKVQELDGELLSVCSEAEAINRQAVSAMDAIEALDDDDSGVMPALDAACPLLVSYEAAVRRAAQLCARTPEGLQAKATLLLTHIAAEQDTDALAASLARDVVGRA